MSDNLFYALLIFLGVDTIALLFLLISYLKKEAKRKEIRHYGDRAEEKVRDYIEGEFPGAVLLNNIFLKTDRGGITQIDHILLCKWGVFVIETKSHNGKILVEKRDWVQIYGDKVVHFHSPFLQNEVHRKALCRVLNESRHFSKTKVTGLVVFTSDKVYFSKKTEGVIRLRDLAPLVKYGSTLGNRHRAVTATPKRSYLSRQKILALEKLIKKQSIQSLRKQSRHEATLKRLDRRDYKHG